MARLSDEEMAEFRADAKRRRQRRDERRLQTQWATKRERELNLSPAELIDRRGTVAARESMRRARAELNIFPIRDRPDAPYGYYFNDRTTVEGDYYWAVELPEPIPRERTRVGAGNSQAKLTEEDVRAIRKRFAEGGISKMALGKQYGVSDTSIKNVVLRRKWAHVED
jgi:hypothetical protein